jgi:CPA1 family monovalent cation:H+ antiporter
VHSLTVPFELLLVAAAVGLLARRVRIHPNVALVLAGVVLGASHLIPAVALDPDVVIHVFLPVLLFEAAISTDLRRLRQDVTPIAVLALPGMMVTVGVAGAVLRGGLHLPWPVALLLGSILAATDTIAVIATFRKVRVPGRLTTIVENESLFNDGTALVAYTSILAIVMEGHFHAGELARSLVWVTVGGILVGLAVGWVASQLLKKVGDHLMEIMITVVITYGSWLLAHAAHASPVIAVVTAGITLGTVGWPGLTPTGKVAIRSVWQVAAFGVNSMVFLMLGLQVRAGELVAAGGAILWGLLALTLGRAAAVYPTFLALRLRKASIPMAWQHLLLWGNLKGSLSMALALSLPTGVPYRDLIIATVFGCTLVTLVVQGLTLAPLARLLGVGRAGEAERQMQEHQGRLLAARAAQAEVDRLQHLGVLPLGVFQRLRASYQGAVARSERQLRDLMAAHPDEGRAQLGWLRRHLLIVEKGAIQGAATSGILAEEVAADLSADLDRALSEMHSGEGKE